MLILNVLGISSLLLSLLFMKFFTPKLFSDVFKHKKDDAIKISIKRKFAGFSIYILTSGLILSVLLTSASKIIVGSLVVSGLITLLMFLMIGITEGLLYIGRKVKVIH